ncbi:holin [Dickeya phage Sucellus]|nr:holin [Dickeya phage Sucellus]
MPNIKDMYSKFCGWLAAFFSSYSSAAAKAAGATGVTVGVIGLNEIAIIVGIICTVGTFIINWFYKWKEYKLKRGEK